MRRGPGDGVTFRRAKGRSVDTAVEPRTLLDRVIVGPPLNNLNPAGWPSTKYDRCGCAPRKQDEQRAGTGPFLPFFGMRLSSDFVEATLAARPPLLRRQLPHFGKQPACNIFGLFRGDDAHPLFFGNTP